MRGLPIVALIGQTNAGKSSLLNRLARRNIAIVAREEGTTRDSVSARIDDQFLLIDTAGLKDPEDDFEATIQDQIAEAIDAAEVILLVLDSTKYPDDKDRQIAKAALKSKKPVLLLLNKSDKGESLPGEEFLRLGIKSDYTIRTSATTGQGVRELTQKIADTLLREVADAPSSLRSRVPRGERAPDRGASRRASDSADVRDNGSVPSQEPRNDGRDASVPQSGMPDAGDNSLTIALIGRPNVGKSSLFNSLGRKQQAIVSSRQGTTRDVNRVSVKYNGREIEILDTAGLRRPGRREVGIEKFSALRTLAAIEEADICALLVDATEPHVKLDQALAGQIIDAGKGIIVVITKSDLIGRQASDSADVRDNGSVPSQEPRNDGRDASVPQSGMPDADINAILDRLETDFDFIPYAPVLITSSETGKNVTKLFDLVETVDESRRTEIPTPELNNILREAIASHPPAGLKNTHPKPKYIVQTDTCPPWFVLHGREMQMMHWSYKRYLERKIREKYPLVGTPIMFSFHNEKKGERK